MLTGCVTCCVWCSLEAPPKGKVPDQPSRVTGGTGHPCPAESPRRLHGKRGDARLVLKHALKVKQGFTVLMVSEVKTSLTWSLQDWMTAELERCGYKYQFWGEAQHCFMWQVGLVGAGKHRWPCGPLQMFLFKHWDLLNDDMRSVGDCI